MANGSMTSGNMTSGSIIVTARVRPLSSQERDRREASVVNVEAGNTISIHRMSVFVLPSSPPSSPRACRPSSPWRADVRTSRSGNKKSPSPTRGRTSIWNSSPSRTRGHSAAKTRSPSVADRIAMRMTFVFDAVFDSTPSANLCVSQMSIYENTGRQVLKSAMSGVNGCLFAYGQTGSGKTFSMMGTSEAPGILPLLANELFDEKGSSNETISLSDGSSSAREGLQVGVSFLELYNEKLVDLLAQNGRAPAALKMFEHSQEGVTVPGLSVMEVKHQSEFGVLMDLAARNRAAGATRMNKNSSRSHAIVQLRLRRLDRLVQSKIYIIDLAGSERPKNGFHGGTPNKEGININVSLSTLGLVISRLSDIAQGRRGCSVPFRDSKLTFLLKDSLTGNAQTHVLITLSPAASCFEESMSTLRFAQSAKRICTRAVADVVKGAIIKKDARALQYDIECLQNELHSLRAACKCSAMLGSNGIEQPSGRNSPNAVSSGDLFTGSSCASFGPHQSSEHARETGAPHTMQQPTEKKTIELRSDGWFRISDSDAESAMKTLQELGFLVKILPATSKSWSRQSSPASEPFSPLSGPSRDADRNLHAFATSIVQVGDHRVSEALRILQTASRDSPTLAKVHLAVRQVSWMLVPQRAMEFIEHLTRLSFRIDEANELLKHVRIGSAANRILLFEVTWLSPGPNLEMAPSELLRVKVVRSTTNLSSNETCFWSASEFEEQLTAMHNCARSSNSYTNGKTEASEESSLTSGKLSLPIRGRRGHRSRANSGECKDQTSRFSPWGSNNSTPEQQTRSLLTTPEARKRAILESDGFQVSLCERAAICYPLALPSKERFAQRKLPRPVSPESCQQVMIDEVILPQPRTNSIEIRENVSDRWLAHSRQPHSRTGSITPVSARAPSLQTKSPAVSLPRTPVQHTSRGSTPTETLERAREALSALVVPMRPQSAEPLYAKETTRPRQRRWRSLTPSAPASYDRRGSSARRRMGVSVGPGNPDIVAGAFDRNSLRLRNGRLFVEALDSWRTGSHSVSARTRQVPGGTCAVYVRIRPMFQHEVDRCDFDVLTVMNASGESTHDIGQEIVHHACVFDKSAVTPFICHTRFPFDGVFGVESTDEAVYRTVAHPLLHNIVQGNSSTIFLFGQTNTGKTHTMRAIEKSTAEALFSLLDKQDDLLTRKVTLSCFELVGRKALDLLVDTKTEIRLREEEDGCFRPHDCEELVANHAEELMLGLRRAAERRATDATAANFTSSRSHLVCRITVQQNDRPAGQLLLVDCAGLERARDTLDFRGQHQRESAEINSALFALKDCIRYRQAAINKHGGLPQDGSLRLPSVRASPLTKVLAESLLSSTAKLAAIATVSPNATDTEHTMDTLRNIYTLGGRGEANVVEVRQAVE